MSALLYHETANGELEAVIYYLDLMPSACECEHHDPA